MLTVEHLRRQEPFSQFFHLEAQLPYPGLNMNAHDSFDSLASFASIPFSYYENPALFVEAPQEALKFGGIRSSSQSSHRQSSNQSSDFPPSLLSSASGASVPSACSSTVGSPYSGNSSHIVFNQDTWISTQGPGFDPTIVNHEVFAPEYIGAGIDPELPFVAHDKLSGNFVGECADLSSFEKRSSTFPTNVSSNSLSLPPQACFSASPEPLTIDSILDRATATSTAERNNPTVIRDGPARPIKKERSTSQRSDIVFKSPTTPASAHLRNTSSISPTDTRSSPSASYPLAGLPTTKSYAQRQQPSIPTPQHVNQFQTHFFAQSSGSFMAPLESSYPSLIEAPRTSYADLPASYAEQNLYSHIPQTYHSMSPAASPALSPQNHQSYPAHFSPPTQYTSFSQQPEYANRRQSVTSYHSVHSQSSPMSGSGDFDDETKEKGRCPFHECGRVFKDLKAHMLTHQSERPEKCPILNCEYNQKGFARKYDKNRHTLTHYKGTMVCGFCPGSGSAAEKSFNRADVFKRHLTSVHGVEQTPPNSRKRSPTGSAKKLSNYCEDATGKCSTCSATFINAQDFYEHLDDCVLRVVQQEEPSEAINQHHLAQISADEEVKETMERNMVKTEESMASMEDVKEEEEEDDYDDDDDGDDEEYTNIARAYRSTAKNARASGPSRAVLSGGISKSSGRPAKKGLTYSKGGVPLMSRGRKKRKHYPPSWGMSADKMQMKKRVLCVYDGERRLWKDDLMMHNEFEVRMKLPDGKSYVTDLDVETLKRAEGFHNATEEERGPWIQEQPSFDLEALMS